MLVKRKIIFLTWKRGCKFYAGHGGDDVNC